MRRCDGAPVTSGARYPSSSAAASGEESRRKVAQRSPLVGLADGLGGEGEEGEAARGSRGWARGTRGRGRGPSSRCGAAGRGSGGSRRGSRRRRSTSSALSSRGQGGEGGPGDRRGRVAAYDVDGRGALGELGGGRVLRQVRRGRSGHQVHVTHARQPATTGRRRSAPCRPDPDLASDIDACCRLTGEFTLRSGPVSHEYFDKYLFESDPALLRAWSGSWCRPAPRGHGAARRARDGRHPDRDDAERRAPGCRRCSSARRPRPTAPASSPRARTSPAGG